jgi:hypothetical protein
VTRVGTDLDAVLAGRYARDLIAWSDDFHRGLTREDQLRIPRVHADAKPEDTPRMRREVSVAEIEAEQIDVLRG